MVSAMEYRRLGSAGLKVSALSFGSWVTFKNQVDVSQAKEILSVCKEYGVNFFDNAETYAQGHAEQIMGQAIKELGWRREDYVISTKIYFGTTKGPNQTGLSRKHIVEGLKASLERLQHDYVDLVYCHRPDPETPIEETVRAMNWVVDQGWALYWGSSEWSAEQLQEAWNIADALRLQGPQMEQPEYNMFHRTKVEKDFVPLYEKRGLGTTTWSPLASGLLTGKYSGGAIPEGARAGTPGYEWLAEQLKTKQAELAAVDQLKPIADKLDCTLAQLALAWCLKNKHVSTVITGATSVKQAKENFEALQVVPKLNDEILQQIEKIIDVKAA